MNLHLEGGERRVLISAERGGIAGANLVERFPISVSA